MSNSCCVNRNYKESDFCVNAPLLESQNQFRDILALKVKNETRISFTACCTITAKTFQNKSRSVMLSQTRAAFCVLLTFISCQDLTGPCKQPNFCLINRSANEQSSVSKDISNLVTRFVYTLILQVTYAVHKRGRE